MRLTFWLTLLLIIPGLGHAQPRDTTLVPSVLVLSCKSAAPRWDVALIAEHPPVGVGTYIGFRRLDGRTGFIVAPMWHARRLSLYGGLGATSISDREIRPQLGLGIAYQDSLWDCTLAYEHALLDDWWSRLSLLGRVSDTYQVGLAAERDFGLGLQIQRHRWRRPGKLWFRITPDLVHGQGGVSYSFK